LDEPSTLEDVVYIKLDPSGSVAIDRSIVIDEQAIRVLPY